MHRFPLPAGLGGGRGVLLVLGLLGLAATPAASGAASPGGAAAPADLAPAGPVGRNPAATRSWLVRLPGPALAESLARSGPPLEAEAGDRVAALEARRRALVEEQQAVRAAILDLGGEPVAAYQVVYNGFLVHAGPAEAAAIAATGLVEAVVPAPLLAPAVGDVVRTIRADKARADLALDGAGTTIAIVDTGLDYSHAAFGGPGTEAAYLENEENRVEPGSFPTAKVVGGYDFAGLRYSPDCPAGADGACTPEPRPDGDPLDPIDLGHGTHVAAIAAGEPTGHLEAGVAPGARLVALKIFGNPLGMPPTSDLAIGALEWVLSHNLGLAVPGAAPPGPIDVVNLSLSADWSSRMPELNEVVDRAVAAGVTVVASAGNGGPHPYVAGSPGAADLALSVGSSWPAGETQLRVAASWTAEGRPESRELEAVEGAADWLPQLADTGPVQSTLAWYGTACDDPEGRPLPPVQDPKKRVALVERGDCDFAEKLRNAEKHGALAVVVFTDGFGKQIMTCERDCEPRPRIPAVMIDRAPGILLRELLLLGAAVNMTLGRFEKTWLTDTVSDFSARGPARFDGGIKPQAVAPGSAVHAALVGSGDRGQTLAGTSMASPAAAGAAALLRQRARRDGLDLSAADLAALLMNYAQPVLRLDRQDTGAVPAVMRQGAGRIDAWQSAHGQTLVRSEHNLAALAFGHLHLEDERLTLRRTLSVRNLADKPQTYTPSFRWAESDEDDAQGAEVTIAPERLTVPAGQERSIELTLEIDPRDLPRWDLLGAEPLVDEARLAARELEGTLLVEATDGRGRPVRDGDQVGLPLHLLPRRHGCTAMEETGPVVFQEPNESVPLVWRNGCGAAGGVEPYFLIGTDARESEHDPDFPTRLDIAAVGLRYGRRDPAQPESPFDIAWAVQMRRASRIPAELELRIYLDLDLDGRFDRVVFNQPGPAADPALPTGRWVVSHAPLIEGTIEPDLARLVPAVALQRYDLDAQVAVLALPAAELGLDLAGGQARFNFAVAAVDAVEDYPWTAGFEGRDYAPELPRRGEPYHVDQAALACLALRDGAGRSLHGAGGWIPAPGRGASPQAHWSARCGPEALPETFGWLFHYPDNRPEAQAAVLLGRAVIPPSPTPTSSPSPTSEPASATPGPTASATHTPQASPTGSPSPGGTPTAEKTPSTDPTPSPTPTASPSTLPPASPGATASPGGPDDTPTPPASATATEPPSSPTSGPGPASATPGASPSATRPPSPSPSASSEPTATQAPSATETPALNLVVDRLTVNQAVQRADGRVPLVAGRPAVLRVAARVEGGQGRVPGVTGLLHARRGGELVPGSPLAPANPGAAIAAPERAEPSRPDDLLAFLLPPAWLQEGEITVWVELNPGRLIPESRYDDNRGPETRLALRPVPPLELVLVPVAYQPGGVGPVRQADPRAADAFGLDFLRAVFPLDELHLELHPPLPFHGNLESDSGRHALLQSLAWLRLREQGEPAWVGGTGARDAAPLYLAILPPGLAMEGPLAFAGGGLALAPAQGAEAAAAGLALALGLRPVACAGADPAGADPAYPYPGGAVGQVGWDLRLGRPVPATHFDFLSGCRPAWVSDYHYEALLGALAGLGPAELPAAAGAEPIWLVAGSLASGGQAASLEILEARDDARPATGPGAGPYALELADLAGRPLFRHAFAPLDLVGTGGAEGRAGFGLALPRLEGAAELRLWGPAGILARRPIPADAEPELALDMLLLPPSARAPDRLGIVWQARHPQGLPARASLRYSPDGGATWQTLVMDAAGRIEIDRAALPGSPNGLLALVATAGGSTATRTAALGPLPNHPPAVRILGAPVVHLADGASALVLGEAVDAEDGALGAERLAWSAPSAGLAGQGSALLIPAGLPPGSHRLGLSATDSAGSRTDAEVLLLVAPRGRAWLPWAGAWRRN